jgi:hypothetical protein
LAHLSLEVGHLYMDDYKAGLDQLRRKFAAVRPWADFIIRNARDELGDRARISTCYLVDDYFDRTSAPGEVIPMVLEAAESARLSIDYLVRESACATDDGLDVAQLVVGQIIAEPPQRSNGSRPPATVSGWLSNGRRTPSSVPAAMTSPQDWQPPEQTSKRNHSNFADIELWKDGPNGRLWSCSFLAAVWQLARLGLLRFSGAAVLQPRTWDGPWPASWDELPGVLRLGQRVADFSAYATMSVLAARFLDTENAVKTILSQISPDPQAMVQAVQRAHKGGLVLPGDITSRIGYVFMGDPWQCPG